jgi:hypothetical protein
MEVFSFYLLKSVDNTWMFFFPFSLCVVFRLKKIERKNIHVLFSDLNKWGKNIRVLSSSLSKWNKNISPFLLGIICRYEYTSYGLTTKTISSYVVLFLLHYSQEKKRQLLFLIRHTPCYIIAKRRKGSSCFL